MKIDMFPRWISHSEFQVEWWECEVMVCCHVPGNCISSFAIFQYILKLILRMVFSWTSATAIATAILYLLQLPAYSHSWRCHHRFDFPFLLVPCRLLIFQHYTFATFCWFENWCWCFGAISLSSFCCYLFSLLLSSGLLTKREEEIYHSLLFFFFLFSHTYLCFT